MPASGLETNPATGKEDAFRHLIGTQEEKGNEMIASKAIRKAVLMGIAAAGILMAGCVAGGTAKDDRVTNTPDATKSEGGEGIGGDPSEAMAGMPNPWSEAGSATEAATGAGLASGFVVPDEVVVRRIDFDGPVFQFMDGIAEARYEAPASQVIIRKGKVDPSLGSLAGDYNDYEASWTVDLEDGVTLACSGHAKGEAILAEWTVGDDSYSVACYGLGGEDVPMTEAELTGIARAVR